MAYEHRGSVTEELLEREGVARKLADRVPIISREAARCIPAQERSDRAEAGVGERGEEVAPGPRRVGETVQAERERRAPLACLEQAEADPAGLGRRSADCLR
jgi:hypothetical protein